MRYLVFLLIFLLLTVINSPISHAYHPVKTKEIVIPLNNWSSQRVLSRVVGNLIEQLGEKVSYQNISEADQWGALRQGIVHLQVEVWQPPIAGSFNEMVENKFILDMGTHRALTREDWWFPEFVKEQCPGLPDWQAMNRCAHLFADDSSDQRGIYYTGPWNYGDADLIRALNLKFNIKRLANDQALWQKLKAANKVKKPIMLLNWRPNWTDNWIKGEFVAFPAYSLECEREPKWGVNKNLAKDCGNPVDGWLKKAAWTGLENKWPCVFQLIKQVNFTNEMIAEASALIVVDSYTEDEAADVWINKYKSHTEQWLDLTCRLF